jgi:D-alanyl-D-alanine carboxypeptidase/D-alanyl-D-alanine-endopeptidase (penicillin-binding protein 4)
MLLRRSLVAVLCSTFVASLAGDAVSDLPATSSAPLDSTTSPAPEIQTAVHALVADHAFKDASIGIAVLDVDTGKYLALSNEHAPLNPASNAKLYTAAAALAILHGNHRFETTLSGRIKEGAVVGPLILRGQGDPSLATADLWGMVQELASAGVKRIDGDILVDQRFFDEQTTPPAFEQQPNEWAAFRAPVSAVALNENTITLAVRPAAVGTPALVAFDPPGFVDADGSVRTVENGADTVGLELTGNGRRLSAKLSGAVAQDARIVRYTRRVEDPTLLAGYALRAILEQAGVRVSGDVKAGSHGAPVIARHQSAPLSSLLYALGKSSDNFYAEMVFKSLGGEAKGRPAKSADGAELVMRWLDKVGANDAGVVVKNGSGLFDANRVTAASIVQVLRAAWRDGSIQPEYVAQLSVGGVDGTLRGRFHGERGRRAVRAKTGTLDDAIALSGYVLGPVGKGPIAFSIVMNHIEGKVAAGRAAADTLVDLLVRRQWGTK